MVYSYNLKFFGTEKKLAQKWYQHAGISEILYWEKDAKYIQQSTIYVKCKNIQSIAWGKNNYQIQDPGSLWVEPEGQQSGLYKGACTCVDSVVF